MDFDDVCPLQHSAESFVGNPVGIEIAIDLVQIRVIHLNQFLRLVVPHRETFNLRERVIGEPWASSVLRVGSPDKRE